MFICLRIPWGTIVIIQFKNHQWKLNVQTKTLFNWHLTWILFLYIHVKYTNVVILTWLRPCKQCLAAWIWLQTSREHCLKRKSFIVGGGTSCYIDSPSGFHNFSSPESSCGPLETERAHPPSSRRALIKERKRNPDQRKKNSCSF